MIESIIKRDDIHATAQHLRPSILRPDFSKNDFIFNIISHIKLSILLDGENSFVLSRLLSDIIL